MEDIIHSMDMSLNKLWEIVKDREVSPAAVLGGLKELATTGQLNSNNAVLVF